MLKLSGHTAYRFVMCKCALLLCRWAINAQYIVTIRSITNIAVVILAILQVQTSNTVLSATVVTQVFPVSYLMVNLIRSLIHLSGKQ